MNIQLTSQIAPADLDLLKEIYYNSFPEEEQRPWDMICKPDRKDCPRLYEIIADGRLAGLATLWIFDRFAYIEHLAVSEEFRSRGVGSDAVKCILDEVGEKPLVVEIEPPCDKQPETVRRHKFYTRLGFNTIDRDYIQPPYRKGLPSVALHLMATTILPAGSTSRTLHSEVYKI